MRFASLRIGRSLYDEWTPEESTKAQFLSHLCRLDALTDRVDALPDKITGEVMKRVRILHEDVIDRLKTIHEGQSPRPRPESRKKR
jgi:hypothetical protein